MRRKYYDTRREANAACDKVDPNRIVIKVFRMPKGTRKAGKFAVCSYIEWLNTY